MGVFVIFEWGRDVGTRKGKMLEKFCRAFSKAIDAVIEVTDPCDRQIFSPLNLLSDERTRVFVTPHIETGIVSDQNVRTEIFKFRCPIWAERMIDNHDNADTEIIERGQRIFDIPG